MPDASSNLPASLFRILDANQNRSREGLRVVEEYLRFVLDDGHLAAHAKQLRHRLQEALVALPRADLLLCRDTTGDVGTELSTASEAQRADFHHVVAAAFSRVQQSLRVLEEYGKTVAPAMPIAMEQLRYDTYTLEKAVGATVSASERLADCRVYVLLDGLDSESAFSQRVQQLIAAGVEAIQLRDKHLDDRSLLARAKTLRKLTAESHVLAIVNDRPDLALLSHADGVHVGQEELPVAEVRRIVGPRMLIGLSTHSIEQARNAVLAGADYLGVGPVFLSTTKSFEQFAGLEFVGQVAREIRLPAFAIGGIVPENVAQVIAQGIRRVAIGGAVAGNRDPAEVIGHLQGALQGP
jgi:thiamine-phosphate pyrophosphorylase